MATPVLAAGTDGASAELQVRDRRRGRVIAGPPRSGRSTALVEHFLGLIEAGAAPESIAVVVPDAARVARLSRRLETLMPGGWTELAVLTPRGLACRVLARTPSQAHLPDAILGAGERLALLLERIDELELTHHDFAGNAAALLAGLVRRIDACKAGGIDAGAYAAWAAALDDDQSLRAAVRSGQRPLEGAREREFAALFAAHDRLLRGAGLLDWGEALALAARLAAEPGSAERCGIAHVLVDDAHELSPAAVRLCEALAGERPVLAGEPGPEPAALGCFGYDPERVEVEERFRRRPTADRRVWRAATERAQAQAVAARIERLLQAPDPVDPDRIAVLVPAVARDGAPVAVALEERTIPHRLLGGAAFFTRAEVRDVVAWLRWLCDPADAAAAVRALSRPPVELRSVDVARVTQIARRRKLDMVAALAAAIESPLLPPEARDRIRACLTLYRVGADGIDTGRVDLYVHRLIERLGMRRRHLFAAQAEVVEQLRSLARLGDLAAAHAARAPQASPRDFARSLASVAEQGALGLGEDGTESDGPVGEIRILDLDAAASLELDHVFILGLSRSTAVTAAPVVPPGLVPGPAARPSGLGARVEAALARAEVEAVLASVDSAGGPHPWLEAMCAAAGLTPDPVTEELYAPGESLAAAYGLLRDQLLAATPGVAGRLAELRLDTDLDIAHAVTRYLELVKVAALMARPETQPLAEALDDVNRRLAQAATAQQAEILATSPLDGYLLGSDADARGRARLRAAREERSLARFLPLRGDGVLLSASDIDLYRACPLKYKFARVLRIPQEPTLHQRFGIAMHQVLERYHQTDAGAPGGDLLGLLDTAWRRQGFGASGEERQLRRKAEAALGRYGAQSPGEGVVPTWFERPFSFRIGPHLLRGRVDRVDRLADGGYELIDYKTGRPRGADALAEDVQLSLYTVAAREAWGLERSRGAYVYLLDDAKVAISGDAAREAWIRAVAEEVAAGIRAERFEPTPSPAACGYCDYRLACPVADS